MRRCCRCGKAKRLKRDFYVINKSATDNQRWHYRCKKCECARMIEYRRRIMKDEVRAKRRRKQEAEWKRLRRRRNPERVSAEVRRFRARRKLDPARMDAVREGERLRHNLKRERDGRVTEDGRYLVEPYERRMRKGPIFDARPDERRVDDHGEYVLLSVGAHWRKLPENKRFDGRRRGVKLPAAPLAKAVRRRVDATRNGDSMAVAVARYGVSIRTLERWETGDIQFVQETTADAVLTLARLTWTDVWDEEEPKLAKLIAA